MIQTVAPVLAFVGTISDKNVVVSHFRPCNGKPCVYMRATEHRDMALPSSTFCTPNFLTVQNGFAWNANQTHWACNWNQTQWLTCGNKSRSEIEDYCEAEENMLSIQNPAAEEVSKHFLMAAIMVKGFADCLHDCLLLKNKDKWAEYLAITSLIALSFATVLSFIWSSGFAEVFSSYDGSGDCACYYVREAPSVLFGCLVPLSLLAHFLFRSDNVLRALTHGMYLYSWYDNVPVWLLRRNPLEGDTINRSLITPVIHGNPEVEEKQDGLLAHVVQNGEPEQSPRRPEIPDAVRIDPLLDQRVPRLPALGELPEVVRRGICERRRQERGCTLLFVFAVLLEVGSCAWRSWLMTVADSLWLFLIEVGYFVLVVGMVLILVVTCSNRFTMELRGGVLLVWLQIFTIRWCSSIVMDTLYFRTAKWLVDFMGHEELLPVNDNSIFVSHCISNVIIGASLIYTLVSYRYFVQEFPDRQRDILVDSSSDSTEVEE